MQSHLAMMSPEQRARFSKDLRRLLADNPGRWPLMEGMLNAVEGGARPQEAVRKGLKRTPWWKRLLGLA